MGFLGLIRRVGRTFTPLERRLLDAVGGALSGDARERFDRQLEAVNKVQRLAEAREVNLYRMRGGKPYNDPALAFADRRLEAELARVRFRVPGEATTHKVTLYLVQGFVFSLIFDPAAEPVLVRDDVEIVDVKLLADPDRERTAIAPPPMADPADLGDELAAWRDHADLSGARQPLGSRQRRERLGEIPARLPADYLRLTEQADGFLVGPWKVFGLAEVYGIALDDAEYQVLAELRDRGVLAVENDTSDLYFVPFDGEPRERASGFVDTINSRLASADAPA